MRIYFAAPLHDREDRVRNAALVKQLRKAGHKVFSPGENGVWEDMVKEAVKQGQTQEQAVESVREMLYHENVHAIRECQGVVAYFGERSPSEGAMWEMGFAKGLGKWVFLLNDKGWRFNLMPEFGSDMLPSVKNLLKDIESTEAEDDSFIHRCGGFK